MNTPSSRMVTVTPRCSAIGARGGDDPVHDVAEVGVLEVEHGGAGVEPADLEQVAEQVLEPVELLLQQLRGPRGHRVEAAPRVVQHVTGHPHGGQRSAQLVGDVGDEPALHAGELDELADLRLQRLGHLVERHGEAGDVVLAGDVHPLLEPAGRDPLGHPAGQPDRGDHLPGDERAPPRRPAAGAARRRSAAPGAAAASVCCSSSIGNR